MKKILSFTVCIIAAIVSLAQTSDKVPGSNCDNAVHNTLPSSAPDRSATECEIQFEHNVRVKVMQAFSKVFQNFNEKDWAVSDTAFDALQEVGKHTEKQYLSASYYFKIDLKPQSELYRSFSEGYRQLQNEMANPKPDTYKKLGDYGYKMNNAIHINFYVTINNISNDIAFKAEGKSQVFSLPGATYAVKGTQAVGVREGTHDAAFIVLGKMKLSEQSKDDFGTGYRFEAIFPKTGFSHLTVQAINIRIECNDELLNKILKEIDLKKLAEMIGQ